MPAPVSKGRDPPRNGVAGWEPVREYSSITQIERVGSDEWKIVRTVRLAALEDAPDWFWATHDDEADRPEGWWREFIDRGVWFVAWEEEQPVGIVAAISDPAFDESDRQLISMWVAPVARNRGLGSALVERVKEWARSEGIRELRLDVTDGNDAALRLYLRSGFRPSGHTTPHPRDPSLAEREMRLQV